MRCVQRRACPRPLHLNLFPTSPDSANQLHQSLGYLVIFNCSDRQLVISSEESSEVEFPPRINYAGKTVFAISIDVCPDTISASKERPTSRQVVSFKDLIGE